MKIGFKLEEAGKWKNKVRKRGFLVHLQYLLLMHKNKITIISRSQYENADIETQSKQFFIDQNKIRYENKLEIIQNKHGATKGINVVNNLCRVNKNNKLTKTTYVYFQDKVIKIQDEFYLENGFRYVKVDSQSYEIKKPIQSKVQTNKQNGLLASSIQSQRKRKKKDLKNIVKNIVKIFLQWLHKYPKKQSCTGSMKQLLAFHKYNNSLIRAMSQIPQINQAFTTFLSTQSKQLIQTSRIHDKPTHLQKLRKYQSVFGMNKKHVGIVTSGNGSNQGNSSENKNGSGSEDKEKLSMNNSMNDENNGDHMNGEKMFADPNGSMNQNINNSKGSDSDKLFNSSSNGSSENNNNSRNKRSSNGSMKEDYNRGEGMNNPDNQLFFSSGSDQ